MLGQLATTGIGSGTSIDIIKFHAMFSAKNADMILSSKDDIHFQVRSQLLQDTSEWFRTLLSLPKNVPGANETDILRLDETGDVLAALLRMASGMEIPELSSIEFCEDILNAAEKYEMPGPISIIRLALSSSLLSTSPIRIYGIAASRNWVAEAKAASTRTLSIDLFHADNIPEISRLDSHILTKLLLLHHTRRQAFKAALDNASVFYASGGPSTCNTCMNRVDHVNWALCRYNWVTSGPVAYDILHADELRRALESTCAHCGKKLYIAEPTINHIKGILECLPTTVDFP